MFRSCSFTIMNNAAMQTTTYLTGYTSKESQCRKLLTWKIYLGLQLITKCYDPICWFYVIRKRVTQLTKQLKYTNRPYMCVHANMVCHPGNVNKIPSSGQPIHNMYVVHIILCMRHACVRACNCRHIPCTPICVLKRVGGSAIILCCV